MGSTALGLPSKHRLCSSSHCVSLLLLFLEPRGAVLQPFATQGQGYCGEGNCTRSCLWESFIHLSHCWLRPTGSKRPIAHGLLITWAVRGSPELQRVAVGHSPL